MSAQPRSRTHSSRAPAKKRAPARRSVAREKPRHLRLATPKDARREAARKRKPRARGRLSRPFLFTTFVVIATGIFGLVLLNVFLAQSSFELEELRVQVATEEARFRDMRLEVASKESPYKVAESASSLGMVPPDAQEYIVGPPSEVQVAESEERIDDKQLKALLGNR